MNTNPSFFKILLGDFTTRLVLPPRFTRLHRDGMERNSKLRTGSGETWDVKIEQTATKGKLCFTKGWTKFVRDANLEPGEFIVFWFDRNESTFDVAVYGIKGCRRAIQGRSGSSSVSGDSDDEVETVGGDQEQDDTSDENSMEDEHSEAETDAEFDNTPDPKFHIKLKSCHKSRLPICNSFAEKVGFVDKDAVVLEYLPTRRCSTVIVDVKLNSRTVRIKLASGWREFWVENRLVIGKTYSFMFNQARNVFQVQPDDSVQDFSSPSNLRTPRSNSRTTKRNWSRIGGQLNKKRSKAYQQAKDYWVNTNRALSLTAFLQPAYLKGSLSIRKSIVGEYLPDPMRNIIQLRVASGKMWKVNCLCSKTTAHISGGGWRNFASDNKLKAGDACVIEVNERNHSIWDVTIFRG